MNFGQKLGYIALGSVFTLLGVIITVISPIVADDDTKLFDGIACKRLSILDENSKIRLFSSVEDIPAVTFIDESGDTLLMLSGGGINSDGETVPPGIGVGNTREQFTFLSSDGITVYKNGEPISTSP